MRKLQVLFISTPAVGNLVPTVEFAQRLTDHDPRFSSTVLIISMAQRPIVNAYIQSCCSTASSATAINFIHLPSPEDPPSPDQYQSSFGYMCLLIDRHKVHVKHAISQLLHNEVQVSGLFVDMFSTSMVDVADELNIPCYLYFASPASFLGFMLHLPILDTQLATDFIDSDNDSIVPKDPSTKLIIPGFANPLPPQVLPTYVLRRKQDGYSWFLYHASRYKETKGMVVNTFQALEQHAINSLSASGLPPIYPIGPVLDLGGPIQWHPNRGQHHTILKWLDDQPMSSVVFLCFGSMGSLGSSQLREIAIALERTGFRFLWSIREPGKGKLDVPADYANAKEILPEGFLDRTAGIGLVCGWVPQVTILAHQAIGGFISHCGWNSILESLWRGVPIATWPIYAEQQMNAFQLVKELGLAVEIRLDYRNEGNDLVPSEEVERGIKCLMEGDNEVRKRVKEMSQKSRIAAVENGSSYASLTSLTDRLAAGI
ncbi:UDP-glycosyltransferase 43 [Ricinus communis]|uniref:Glycosyltransferase n=1 Tax=Ricinus communis TaxID=3988 RepID=B9SQ86_RICCO|nr:UDP-glycosyltransferase 43 [Ricinus communis]EEF34246.1 UDP-glucosyltransferase, putative [Ricinus communis]|eukprot:XP_002528155.1 UDP-glycosyltransferase 43 [Ricinus communis]